MPISGIGFSANLTPSFGIPDRETRIAEQRAKAMQALDFSNFGLIFNRRLQFIVDNKSNDVIVKIIDKTTDEVVRVIPPEELQRLKRGLREVFFLFSKRV